MLSRSGHEGFTLIEVLLALAIIAIAFTALLRSLSSTTQNTTNLKDKTISHWVQMQGAAMVQLGLIPLPLQKEVTEVTTLFGQKWYWRAVAVNTPSVRVQKIIITISHYQAGPFGSPLIAYRYQPHG